MRLEHTSVLKGDSGVGGFVKREGVRSSRNFARSGNSEFGCLIRVELCEFGCGAKSGGKRLCCLAKSDRVKLEFGKQRGQHAAAMLLNPCMALLELQILDTTRLSDGITHVAAIAMLHCLMHAILVAIKASHMNSHMNSRQV